MHVRALVLHLGFLPQSALLTAVDVHHVALGDALSILVGVSRVLGAAEAEADEALAVAYHHHRLDGIDSLGASGFLRDGHAELRRLPPDLVAGVLAAVLGLAEAATAPAMHVAAARLLVRLLLHHFEQRNILLAPSVGLDVVIHVGVVAERAARGLRGLRLAPASDGDWVERAAALTRGAPVVPAEHARLVEGRALVLRGSDSLEVRLPDLCPHAWGLGQLVLDRAVWADLHRDGRVGDGVDFGGARAMRGKDGQLHQCAIPLPRILPLRRPV
mmetsp:Transcript_4884/g.19512  ORF Transcript_4884/g.19512 Transcript_4884/m.19512 type:complete len:273 (-) Transcript_4884:315-1133(-)